MCSNFHCRKGIRWRFSGNLWLDAVQAFAQDVQGLYLYHVQSLNPRTPRRWCGKAWLLSTSNLSGRVLIGLARPGRARTLPLPGLISKPGNIFDSILFLLVQITTRNDHTTCWRRGRPWGWCGKAWLFSTSNLRFCDCSLCWCDCSARFSDWPIELWFRCFPRWRR